MEISFCTCFSVPVVMILQRHQIASLRTSWSESSARVISFCATNCVAKIVSICVGVPAAMFDSAQHVSLRTDVWIQAKSTNVSDKWSYFSHSAFRLVDSNVPMDDPANHSPNPKSLIQALSLSVSDFQQQNSRLRGSLESSTNLHAGIAQGPRQNRTLLLHPAQLAQARHHGRTSWIEPSKRSSVYSYCFLARQTFVFSPGGTQEDAQNLW